MKTYEELKTSWRAKSGERGKLSKDYDRFARIRHELEELAGEPYLTHYVHEVNGMIDKSDRSMAQFLRQQLIFWRTDPKMIAYCLKELRRLYGHG